GIADSSRVPTRADHTPGAPPATPTAKVAQGTAAMSTHVDPIPREARPFQGHRAGLVTRTAAAAIDIGIVLLALGVCYLGVSAFLFLLNPRSFSAPTPSLAVMCGAGGLFLVGYLAVSWVGNGRTY